MAAGNGDQSIQEEEVMPGEGGNNLGNIGAPVPLIDGDHNIVTRQWIIEGTGQVYSGLVLNYAGRTFTTTTGAYEGIFSRPLSVSTTGGNQPEGIGRKLPGPTRRGNGNITPGGPSDGQQNQGGGGY